MNHKALALCSVLTTALTALTLIGATVAQDIAQGSGQVGLQRWVLFGTPLAVPSSMPGIAGRLQVQPLVVVPFATGRTVAGWLDELCSERADAPPVSVAYQMLERTRSGRLELSALSHYPQADPGDDVPEAGGYGPASIRHPLLPRIELTLVENPPVTSFTLCFGFKRLDRPNLISLPVTFRRTAGLLWIASEFPVGTEDFESLADTDHRKYWDRMEVANYGGSLRIHRILFKVEYDDLPSGCETLIPILDRVIDADLPAAPFGSRFSLDGAALESRRAWADVDATYPWVIQLASEDLGKSGSDAVDIFAPNPKYGDGGDNLCSEFVSWYYHQAVLPFGNFRDIVSAGQLDRLFNDHERLYQYHLGNQRFQHMRTGAVYTPRAGDYLERRGEDGPEHSMIVLRWNATRREALVINGPWPVTLRTVPVHELEANGGKDFRLGRIGPL